jgi:methylated-DNA-[protein]-cysteine S-methyltransferase
MVYYTHFDSPVGRLLLVGDFDGVRRIDFSTGPMARGADPDWRRSDGPFTNALRQLDAYFSGTRHTLDFAVAPTVSAFQARVLDALRTIPFGETRSYADIAAQIGQPKAVRAVGGANATNPLPLVFPCHRVIGSNGSLTGFGGGLPLKRWLLDFERSQSGLFAAAPPQADTRSAMKRSK